APIAARHQARKHRHPPVSRQTCHRAGMTAVAHRADAPRDATAPRGAMALRGVTVLGSATALRGLAAQTPAAANHADATALASDAKMASVPLLRVSALRFFGPSVLRFLRPSALRFLRPSVLRRLAVQAPPEPPGP